MLVLSLLKYSCLYLKELQELEKFQLSQALAHGRAIPSVMAELTTPQRSVVFMTPSCPLSGLTSVALAAPTGPALSSAVLSPIAPRRNLLSSLKFMERDPIAVHPLSPGTVKATRFFMEKILKTTNFLLGKKVVTSLESLLSSCKHQFLNVLT